MADMSYTDPYQLTRHPAYAEAKEAAEAARAAYHEATKKADALIEAARALKAEASQAAAAGDEEGADALLQDFQESKAKAERARAIADAKEEAVRTAEHTLQVAEEKARKDVGAWARRDRADAEEKALERLSETISAMEELVQVNKAMGSLRWLRGARGEIGPALEELTRLRQNLERWAEEDREYASHRRVVEPVA
jgi:hypothetical protein